jgi:hypothetical protein
MRWNLSTRPGQRFRHGLSSWTSARSPHSASWRWHAHPSGGLLIRSCPLADVCAAWTSPLPDAFGLGLEAGRASAGSQATRLAGDAFAMLWFVDDDRDPI